MFAFITKMNDSVGIKSVKEQIEEGHGHFVELF